MPVYFAAYVRCHLAAGGSDYCNGLGLAASRQLRLVSCTFIANLLVLACVERDWEVVEGAISMYLCAQACLPASGSLAACKLIGTITHMHSIKYARQ